MARILPANPIVNVLGRVQGVIFGNSTSGPTVRSYPGQAGAIKPFKAPWPSIWPFVDYHRQRIAAGRFMRMFVFGEVPSVNGRFSTKIDRARWALAANERLLRRAWREAMFNSGVNYWQDRFDNRRDRLWERISPWARRGFKATGATLFCRFALWAHYNSYPGWTATPSDDQAVTWVLPPVSIVQPSQLTSFTVERTGGIFPRLVANIACTGNARDPVVPPANVPPTHGLWIWATVNYQPDLADLAWTTKLITIIPSGAAGPFQLTPAYNQIWHTGTAASPAPAGQIRWWACFVESFGANQSNVLSTTSGP
jgi:hypothetical protein